MIIQTCMSSTKFTLTKHSFVCRTGKGRATLDVDALQTNCPVRLSFCLIPRCAIINLMLDHANEVDCFILHRVGSFNFCRFPKSLCLGFEQSDGNLHTWLLLAADAIDLIIDAVQITVPGADRLELCLTPTNLIAVCCSRDQCDTSSSPGNEVDC